MSKQGTRARLHFSDEARSYLEGQVGHKQSINDVIVAIVEGKMNHRPCILSVDLPDEERLEYLHSMFEWVQIDRQEEGGAPEALCAGPKRLTYDEAFLLLQKKYCDVGWVYADALRARLPESVETAKNW